MRGKFSDDKLTQEMMLFYKSVKKITTGVTEVRQITLHEATCTIEEIYKSLLEKGLFATLGSFSIIQHNNSSGRNNIVITKSQTWVLKVAPTKYAACT